MDANVRTLDKIMMEYKKAKTKLEKKKKDKLEETKKTVDKATRNRGNTIRTIEKKKPIQKKTSTIQKKVPKRKGTR